ncbi:MAG: YbaB/EbfC family nucleoid-associated protein [Deltaproteobacteria bacterium]|nr:YbaB/EbfC family nucleoid-associated protein [Deltaproteobacteria bacterium]
MFGNMPFDLSSLMEQAKKMQGNLQEMKERLAQEEVEAQAGGGLVELKLNGNGDVLSVKIDKSIYGQINAEDMSFLEGLFSAAISDALKKEKELYKAELSAVFGGLPIPGL